MHAATFLLDRRRVGPAPARTSRPKSQNGGRHLWRGVARAPRVARGDARLRPWRPHPCDARRRCGVEVRLLQRRLRLRGARWCCAPCSSCPSACSSSPHSGFGRLARRCHGNSGSPSAAQGGGSSLASGCPCARRAHGHGPSSWRSTGPASSGCSFGGGFCGAANGSLPRRRCRRPHGDSRSERAQPGRTSARSRSRGRRASAGDRAAGLIIGR